MADFTSVEIDDEHLMVVQVPESSENELVEAGRVRDLSAHAIQTLASTLDSVRDAAHSARTRLVAMPHKPDELDLEFQIQLATEAGVVVASTSASANMKIAFKWTGLNDDQGEN